MDERLTMDEIEARYSPDWVLIVDLETDEFQHILSGKVAFHSPDRDAVWDKAFEFRPAHIAVFFLGKIPDNPVIVTRLIVGWDCVDDPSPSA